MTLYNEIDPFAADWLERLIEAGHISPGRVERRSIKELSGAELEGFNRVHLFAGIGGWDYALDLAGWGTRSIWTGSCPCQPFSAAGKRKGQADDRHLWPDMFRLVRECRPDTIFGEQVASAIGHGWLDGVFADLESEGYACGAAVLGAHSVGAPHIRQRLWWVADSGRSASQRDARAVLGTQAGEHSPWEQHGGLPVGPGDGGPDGRMADTGHSQRRRPDDERPAGEVQAEREQEATQPGRCGAACGVGHADSPRRETCHIEPVTAGAGLQCSEQPSASSGLGDTHESGPQGRDGAVVRERADERSPWSASTWHPCRDGKARRIPIEPALFPLADGVSPGRVGRLRGAGNAIVPAVASEFIRSFMEVHQ